ncbi:ARM repeat-containing protein [Mycena leptocephala]|nr:ARM repeat-containing protein [Mycena leptocephala]
MPQRDPRLSFFSPPPQPMMYPPHSPMFPSPIPPSSAPVKLAEKKLEMQYNLQQQLASRNLMFRAAAAAASPHPQAYSVGLDYGSHMLNAASMYGSNVSPTPAFVQAKLALPRSPLLDEFRANRERKWELRDITGFVAEFRMSCPPPPAKRDKVHSMKLSPTIPYNQCKMYSVIMLFRSCSSTEHSHRRHCLPISWKAHVLHLSSNLYGCHVVQAIESILPNQQASFVLELKPDILRCVKDSNYNHVIQKVIERVSPDRLGFVSTFIGHVFEPASHSFGCRVLQRCPKHLPDAQTRPLLDELLLNHTAPLMRDQFGNYHSRAENKALVAAKLRGHLLFMARPKFASNVCEKALSYADPEARRLLIDEIMAPLSKPESGYYVLQRALRVAEGDQKEALTNTIRSQLMNMRRYSNSKHLASSMSTSA